MGSLGVLGRHVPVKKVEKFWVCTFVLLNSVWWEHRAVQGHQRPISVTGFYICLSIKIPLSLSKQLCLLEILDFIITASLQVQGLGRGEKEILLAELFN